MRDKLVLFYFTIKKMRRNERTKSFLVNNKISFDSFGHGLNPTSKISFECNQVSKYTGNGYRNYIKLKITFYVVINQSFENILFIIHSYNLVVRKIPFKNKKSSQRNKDVFFSENKI